MAHRAGFKQVLAVTTEANRSPSPKNTNSGRWFLVLLGLSLASIGGLFVGLLGRSFMRAWKMRSWPEVSCVILSSEIEERRHDEFSPTEYRQNLTYGYEWQKQPFTGSHLTLRENPWSSNRELVEQRSHDFPEGKVTTCRLNPASPEIAVLKTDSLAPGYSIWFPSLFVIGGLGISVRALRKS
ncbi:MAG: DUF3592 domain-containing protein [Luteolibacter sp.]|uniref:DUF3592 domain-containing protein n=1 Tax=Luteolibacter sp. TaxID=1962973 RepID=UPI0032666728